MKQIAKEKVKQNQEVKWKREEKRENKMGKSERGQRM